MTRGKEYRGYWKDEGRSSGINFSTEGFERGAVIIIEGWISPQSSGSSVFARVDKVDAAVYDYRYITGNGVGNEGEETEWLIIEFGGDPTYGRDRGMANPAWIELVVNSGVDPTAPIGPNGASLSVRPFGAINTKTTTSGSISTGTNFLDSFELWSDGDVTADLDVYEILR